MNNFPSINSNYSSYQNFIDFYQNYRNHIFSDITLNISDFFAANMSSVLGAVIDLVSSNLNTVHLRIQNPNTEEILRKNDFLTYFGHKRAYDNHSTTIQYQKLEPKDGKHFRNYIINDLLEWHYKDLPVMSKGVKEKIVEAIYEIFVNAQIHSESNFIYTCGQFYPQKKSIEFTLVDVGIGFREKVNRRFKRNLSAVQAIEWAIQDKKTTKVDVSGGIGLAVLREFIEKNNGKLQIVSNNGFYEFENNRENKRYFKGDFPGTIVNLQFKTDDDNNYFLDDELEFEDIF
jgi:hypothetical protein